MKFEPKEMGLNITEIGFVGTEIGLNKTEIGFVSTEIGNCFLAAAPF